MTSQAIQPLENALSIDVEEYYHAIIFGEATKGRPAERRESRVEGSMERVLALLDSRRVKATFFVLGEVAADHPAMIRRIAEEGHEIACHGYRHELVSGYTREQFSADVHRAKRLLEDLSGTRVLGYRAPNFSIGRGQPWAYDVLLDEGFRYDSSVYPIRHDRYGDRTAPRFAHEVHRNGAGTLIEFPIGTARLLGVNLPIGGGGYFRLSPLALIQRGIARVNEREGQPVVFFFHPWELDPDQPRPSMPWRHRFRLYVGLRKEEAKLARLLREFRFNSIQDTFGIS